MKTEALFKLVRAVDKQLGQVPEWKALIGAARGELGAIERAKWEEFGNRLRDSAREGLTNE